MGSLGSRSRARFCRYEVVVRKNLVVFNLARYWCVTFYALVFARDVAVVGLDGRFDSLQLHDVCRGKRKVAVQMRGLLAL
jgi:hypothetical protein